MHADGPYFVDAYLCILSSSASIWITCENLRSFPTDTGTLSGLSFFVCPRPSNAIISSATCDQHSFLSRPSLPLSTIWNGVTQCILLPSFTIPGRTFPVETFKPPCEDHVDGAVKQVLQIHIFPSFWRCSCIYGRVRRYWDRLPSYTRWDMVIWTALYMLTAV